ncbi:MAG: fibronectin type III domain-containing protein [Patescibacteria group bacterium]|jgi:hypothetical protein
MKKLWLILLLFMGLTGLAHASGYTVAGATAPAACNGDYTAAGTYNGQTYYKHDTANYWLEWSTGATAWLLVDTHGVSIPLSLFSRTDPAITGAYVEVNGTGSVTVALDEWDAPTITARGNPYTVYKGQTLNILITGTGFKPGIVATTYYTPTISYITVNSTTYISSTQLVMNITGSASMPYSIWQTVKVTNPDAQFGTRGTTIMTQRITKTYPGTPVLAAHPVSPSDVILTITPATGNPPIAGYYIEWQNPSGSAWSVLKYNTLSTATSYSVKALYGDDLTAVTTYKFRVRTISTIASQSDFSTEKYATTFAPYALGKPTGLTEVSTSDTTISCSWTAPVADPPDTPAATDYLVSATDISVLDGETYSETVGSTATSWTLTGLVSATTYEVTVAAINAGGIGDASDSDTMVTTGSTRYTITFDELGSLEGVSVYLYSDAGRTTLVGVLVTDASGNATVDYFNGTYYWTARLPFYQTLTGTVTVDGAVELVEFTLIESVFNIVEPLYYDGANFIYKPQKMYVNGAWKIIRKERHEEDE